MSYAYSSQQKLDNIFTAKENLGVIILGKEKLDGIILGKENLGVVILGKETIGSGASKDLGVALIYDKPNLQFVAANESQLNSIVAANSSLNLYNYQPLCLFGKENLNIVLSNYSLQNVINSQLVAGSLSANTLSSILAQDNLQVIILSTEGLKGMMNLAAMNGLGVIIL